MPSFWINKENPRLISYDPEDKDKWRPIHSEYYGHDELTKPKEGEISYRYKGDEHKGFLFKLSKLENYDKK